MSLSACGKCWDDPCTCGHEYEAWSNEKIYSQIVMLVRVLTVKNSSPLSPIIEQIVEASHRRGIF